MPMSISHNCILLADRHYGVMESLRGLLGTMFDTVVMVSDDASLLAATPRLKPEAVVVDLSLARTQSLQWLQRLHVCLPGVRLVVLSDHDEVSVRRAVVRAGADGYVLRCAVATDLLPALEEVLAGHHYGFPDEAETDRIEPV